MLQAELQCGRSELARAHAHVEALREGLRKLSDEVAALRSAKDAKADELDAVYKSTSWVVTRPLRFARRLMLGVGLRRGQSSLEAVGARAEPEPNGLYAQAQQEDPERTGVKSAIRLNLAHTPSQPAPVFVHSSFRCASTWLWTRFRALADAVAYCEVFHELLAVLKIEDLPRYHPRAWSSHHPDTPPYLLEFIGYLSPTGGVPGYTADMALARLIPPDGPYGALSKEEEAYVDKLIALPSRLKQISVLSDTRTLGRAAGLKCCFGGFHILAVRNLFQQWNSYSNQQLSGNRYFLDTIKTSIEHADHVDYLRRLKEFLALSSEGEPADWLERNAYDDVFVAFVALHIYLYIAALRTADLVIDVNRLASDPDYVNETEQAVARGTGLKVDFSGATDAIEAPCAPLRDPAAARAKIDALLPHAAAELDADEAAIAFARRLLDEMWAEHARYAFYAGPAHRLLALRDDAMRRLEAERDGLASALKAAQQESAQAQASIMKWRGAATAARGGAE